MSTLKNWWPTMLALLTPLVSAFVPQIQDAIASLAAHHPELGIILAGVATALAHVKQSPIDNSGK